jgi:Mor family transcriptional regulator
MSELFDVIQEEVLQAASNCGMPDQDAERLASALEDRIRREYGTRKIYVPAPSKTERNRRIRAEFNGRNLHEIMRRYGVSKMTVYRAAQDV